MNKILIKFPFKYINVRTEGSNYMIFWNKIFKLYKYNWRETELLGTWHE